MEPTGAKYRSNYFLISMMMLESKNWFWHKKLQQGFLLKMACEKKNLVVLITVCNT